MAPLGEKYLEQLRAKDLLKQIFLIVFSAFLAVTTASAQPNSLHVIQANNDGVKALLAKNYPLAIELLKRTIAMDPGYKLAKDNLAITYNELGLSQKQNPKEALKYFHKAMSLNPSNLTSKNNIDSTITKLGKDPKAFFDRVELAESSRNEGDYEGAIVEYKEALRLKDDAKTHEALGDVLRLADKPSEAMNEYLEANGLKHSKQLVEKFHLAEQAIREVPKPKEAVVAMDSATHDAIQSEWEDKLKKDPLSSANHVGLGRALEMRGDMGGAIAEYKQALQLAKNRPPEEKAAIQKRLDRLPGQANHRAMIDAISLFAAKKYDLAIDSFKRIISESTSEEQARKAEAYVYIGNAYVGKGQLPQAQAAYESAWKLDRDFWGLKEARKEYVKAAAMQKNRLNNKPVQTTEEPPSIEELYRRVSDLEIKVFKVRFAKDNIEMRVTQLESQLAVQKESSSISKRVSALEEKTKSEPLVPYDQIPQVKKALTRLEQINLGTTFEAEDILDRIKRLELKLKGKVQTGSILTRLDSLLILN